MIDPGLQQSRVPVLMYHRIGEVAGKLQTHNCVTPKRFVDHMRILADTGLRACTIDEFGSWLDGSVDLGPNAFLLTFDDGFRGIYEHASPVLRELGWTATVFLISTLIGGKDLWHGNGAADADRHLLLGHAEIDEMRRAGLSFQSHSRTHADLTRLGDDAVFKEIAGSKVELEAVLGSPVDYFAYPYGRYDERALRITRAAGYRAAFSVETGFNRRGLDAYRIRRLDVFGSDTPAQLLRKLRYGSNDGSWWHAIHYYARQLSSRWQRPQTR